ncbi:MAG: PaaI family thioesterase [Solirubrobacterales bacterium]|nr:PaaI family thioesterase [Solirubrobacterales bacterium]
MDEYPVPGPRTLDGVLGFRLLEVRGDVARGDAPVTDSVCQRFGMVHGGAYAALAEMVATEATVHHVWPEGKQALGISNNTSFLRPLTAGTIHAEARTRHRGRTMWVWDVDLLDDQQRCCATSRVSIAVRPR